MSSSEALHPHLVDRVVDLGLSRETLTLTADPGHVHRFMATYLPDMGGRSAAIRADTGTQFRIDLPTDPLGAPGRVRMRLRSPVLDHVGEPAPVPSLVTGARVVAAVAAEKRRSDDRGIRVRPVQDTEATAWATELFARHGMRVTDVAVSPARRYGSDGAHFTVRDLAATVTITDPEAATAALTRGIGRGRAYGLGMLVPLTTHA